MIVAIDIAEIALFALMIGGILFFLDKFVGAAHRELMDRHREQDEDDAHWWPR